MAIIGLFIMVIKSLGHVTPHEWVVLINLKLAINKFVQLREFREPGFKYLDKQTLQREDRGIQNKTTKVFMHEARCDDLSYNRTS